MKLKTSLMALVVLATVLTVAPTVSASCGQPYNAQERVECLASKVVTDAGPIVSGAYSVVWAFVGPIYYPTMDLVGDVITCLTGGPCILT